jgi:hypothetical protein
MACPRGPLERIVGRKWPGLQLRLVTDLLALPSCTPSSTSAARRLSRGPPRPGDITALAVGALARPGCTVSMMVTAGDQLAARPLTPNAALSGCGPTSHQETFWNVPAVRLNA